MNVLWILTVAVQILFAIHAVRNGRPMWVFIILFFPLLGSAIYFFVEYLPAMRANPAMRRVGSDMARRVDSGRGIRRLEEELQVADTFANRIELANAYLEAKRPDDAIPLYERCLQGEYSTDPVALGNLCKAYFAKGDYERTLQYLNHLGSIKYDRPTHEFALLYARTLEALGRDNEALRAYEKLVPVATGEEARGRYGLLLLKNGRTGDARRVFDDVLRNARLSPPYYRRSEQKWIRAARDARRKL
ncbi:MAG: tetratricopeptide repeat protein [Chitinivibrionales bacterium]|nr:tetratricopeptide repeat protein [Chitinivibrionales bacterium]